MSSTRAFALVFAASLLLGLFVIEEAEAHRQGLRPGYERMLYDCNHDWGWESGKPLDKGHELVTLDITEGERDGVPMVLIEINMVRVNPSGFGADYQMFEEVRFSTPRASFVTMIETTEELEASYESGDEPAYISQRKPGMTQGGGEDDSLIAFDLGYTYNHLQIQNDEMLSDFKFTAYYEDKKPVGSGNILRGDVVAGGYYRPDGTKFVGCENAPGNDPEQDETYFVAIGYEVQNSTWTVPGKEDPGIPVETVADFSMAPDNPKTLETVRFEDTSYSEEPLSGHTWDLAGGNERGGAFVEHVFERPGRYEIRMDAFTHEGETVSVQKLLVVENRVPLVDFNWEPETPVAGQEVHLADLSEDLDGRIVAWEWRIPGVGERHREDPTVGFPEAGGYELTLIVTDDWGASNRTSKPITVMEPDAGADLGPAELSGPLPIVVLVLLMARVGRLRRRSRA